MAIVKTQRFCEQCDKSVLAEKKGVNHILHLILSAITVGVWIVVWLLLIIFKGMGMGSQWRCPDCGSSKTTR